MVIVVHMQATFLAGMNCAHTSHECTMGPPHTVQLPALERDR